MDPWYPLGSADMLEVAHMAIHALPMTSREEMRWAFDAVTINSTRVMGLPDSSLRVGGPATFVILQAHDPIEAVRMKAQRLYVFRDGKVLAKTPAKEAELFLEGRPAAINPAHYAPPTTFN